MRRSGREDPVKRTTEVLQESNRMARSRNTRRGRNAESTFSLRTMSIMVGTFLLGILILVGYMSVMKSRVRVPIDVRLFHGPTEIPEKTLARIDAILVLGGGVPQSLEEPRAYVQRRCDDAASVVQNQKMMQLTKRKKGTDAASLPILCLSAGTAHLPQLMAADGLPIWESTASAAYLQKRYGLENVYVETTSFDTIGNAFYARTSHTDIVGWRRLLIVTNEFHMARTRAIFDWIFGVDDNGYQLYYLSSPNVGLSDDAIQARNEKEQNSLKAVDGYSQTYRSMRAIWGFLNKKHDLYTAGALVKRGKIQTAPDETTALVKKSYGGTRR